MTIDKQSEFTIEIGLKGEIKDCHLSPDCSGNPFLKKKIATESGKKLLKNEAVKRESGEIN